MFIQLNLRSVRLVFFLAGCVGVCVNQKRGIDEFVDLVYTFNVILTHPAMAADHSIVADRALLAASIPFFRDRLLEESSADFVQIDLSSDVELAAIESLLRFPCELKLRISLANVVGLLKAALYLRMDNVVAACTDFLTPRLTADIAIGILNITDAGRMLPLLYQAEKYANQHFNEVAETTSILDLRTEPFTRLVRSSDLNQTSEGTVLDVVARWLEHLPEIRTPLQLPILRHIRYPLLPLELLSSRARTLYDSTAIQQLRRATPNGCALLPRNGPIHLIVLDYEHGKMQYANWRRRYGKMTMSRTNFGAAVGECEIFVFGGQNGPTNLNSVERYIVSADAWQPVAPMTEVRRLAAAATWDDRIYVTGGDNNGPPMRSAEFYGISTQRWTPVASMLEARLGHQLAVLGDYLYVVGGRRSWDEPLNSVERYDAVANKWSLETPMLAERQAMGVAVLNGKLYACGGYQMYDTETCKSCAMNSSEVFDPVRRVWTFIAPMIHPRKWFSLVAVNDTLLAVGGTNTDGYLDSVEVYDPETDTWTLGTSLEQAAEAITVALRV